MGLFNFFRKNNQLVNPVDLSVLKCDIHSHFIPAIDDGAKTLEDSILMIREMHNFGYRKIITTPHIMSDYFKNTPEIILKNLELLKSEIQKENIPIEIEAAAEYYLDFDFERKLDEEKLLTFGANYLLFEISYLHPPDNLDHIIFKMITQGYKPVLAHPERYNYFHSTFSKYESIIEKGALLQLNINSLTGYYSIPTKNIAEKMIEKNMISFLGTDCHHAGHINLIKDVVYQEHLLRLINSGTLLNSNL